MWHKIQTILFMVMIMVISVMQSNAITISTVVINETFGSSANYSFTDGNACVVQDGYLDCNGNQGQATYIHKLINLSTNTNNATIELYGVSVSSACNTCNAFKYKTANNTLSGNTPWSLSVIFEETNTSFKLVNDLGGSLTLTNMTQYFFNNTDFKFVLLQNSSVNAYTNGTYKGNLQIKGNGTIWQVYTESSLRLRMSGWVMYNGTNSSATANDMAPLLLNISINNTYAKKNQWLNISGSIVDDFGVEGCWLFNNATNINSTLQTLSGTTTQCSSGFQITQEPNSVINFTLYVNDSNGNITQNSTIFTLISSALYWSNNLTNASSATKFNDTIFHSINWSSDITLSSCFFAWNGTDGFFKNISSTNFTNAELGVNLTSNSTINHSLLNPMIIGWKQQCNDTSGNLNITSIFQYNVTNILPNITSISITSNSPPNGNLTCNITNTTDVTSVGFRWYINNVENISLRNLAKVNSFNFSGGQNIICGAQPYDNYDNGTMQNSTVFNYGDLVPPTISYFNVPSSITTGTSATITLNTSDNLSAISQVLFEVENPSGTKTNYSMSQSGGVNQPNTTSTWTFLYTPSPEGTWFASCYSVDQANNIGYCGNRNTSFQVVVGSSSSSTSSGGGGGGTSFTPSIDLTVICGNSICDAGEDAFNCARDCASTEGLVKALQNKVVQGAGILVIVAMVYIGYQERKKRKYA